MTGNCRGCPSAGTFVKSVRGRNVAAPDDLCKGSRKDQTAATTGGSVASPPHKTASAPERKLRRLVSCTGGSSPNCSVTIWPPVTSGTYKTALLWWQSTFTSIIAMTLKLRIVSIGFYKHNHDTRQKNLTLSLFKSCFYWVFYIAQGGCDGKHSCYQKNIF